MAELVFHSPCLLTNTKPFEHRKTQTPSFSISSKTFNKLRNRNGNKGVLYSNEGRKWCRIDSALTSRSGVEEETKGEEDVSIGGGKSSSGYYDAIVIGSGIGGWVAATQLAVKGAKVLVLEKYVIPGGSSGYYQRDGYTFDVGSSVMFGSEVKN